MFTYLASFLLFQLFFSGVFCKIDEELFLSKCKCGKTAQDKLECDFSKLPKKKMKILIDKLLNHKIICVSDDWYYTPIFTASFNNALPMSQHQQAQQAQVSGSGSVVSNTASSASGYPLGNDCKFDGMSCGSKSAGIEFLFPTPLQVTTLVRDSISQQYNQQLKELMLQLEEEDDGCKFNLHGGYRSQDGFLNRKEPAVQWLKSQIIPKVKQLMAITNSSHIPFMIEGWGAVLREGHGQNIHVHPSSIFAGVYYIAAPKEVAASGKSHGCLQFVDPRMGAAMAQVVRGKNVYGETFEICPNEHGGMLVIFPSYLYHDVKPMPPSYKGPRIAISFNVVYDPFTGGVKQV